VADFFKKFNLSEEQLNGLMAIIESEGEEDGAEMWYKDNYELVNSWF